MPLVRGVIHRSYVVTVSTANTANVTGSIALLILELYHRVQTNAYAAVLTCSQSFLYTTWDNIAGPIPASHTTRFVVSSDELLSSKYVRSATGAERPIIIPSVIRLSLGRRLVNILPVPQRTNAFTNGVVGRTMGRWSWVRISRAPWKRFLKKSEYPHVKNLINHSLWVPRDCKELRSRQVRPHTKTKNPAVQSGGECYKA